MAGRSCFRILCVFFKQNKQNSLGKLKVKNGKQLRSRFKHASTHLQRQGWNSSSVDAWSSVPQAFCRSPTNRILNNGKLHSPKRTNCPWKFMLGRRSFPFGFWPVFSGYLSFREGSVPCIVPGSLTWNTVCTTRLHLPNGQCSWMFQTRSVTDPPKHMTNKVNATQYLQNRIHGRVAYINILHHQSTSLNLYKYILKSSSNMNQITHHSKKPWRFTIPLGSPDTSLSFLPIVPLRSWAERTLLGVEPVSQPSGRCFWNLQVKLFPIHNNSQPFAWFFVSKS